ncbi:ABC transporter permease [Devosia sp. Root413D1]|uniref:carbohydrate ABC transporter permease n=1 Tax=unclassified Devosia TaxID=196773 RepID=UPI0006F34DFF|nr:MULTISPECIES: sugar ABC transporter permease [unclassified Devosia]KQU95046.1 ABC transporter permease [Devosia sp. Root105]KQW77602.1 ABC transporter permease [Devosia sp. Root413D1]
MPSSPRRTSQTLRKAAPAYLFLTPWLLGLLGLTMGPTLISLYLSFTSFDLFQAPQWIGADNYLRIATADPNFMASMRVTFMFVVTAVPLKLCFALALAMILNRGISGLPVYRAIFYLPSLLGSSIAVAILWRQLFAGDGVVNGLLAPFGIQGPSWISDPRYSLWSLVLLSAWQFGSPMVIFLAGLRQIPTDLYEAASIDGATRLRKFVSITLPLLTPVIFFNFIVAMIDAFQSFTPAFVVSRGTGGPLNSTLFYALYIYREAFGFFHMGYASALAWVLLVIIAIFTAIAFLTSRFWVYYDA